MFRLHPSHGQAVGPSLLRAEGGHATRLALINSAVEEFVQIKKDSPSDCPLNIFGLVKVILQSLQIWSL